jgi:hypothetical protein
MKTRWKARSYLDQKPPPPKAWYFTDAMSFMTDFMNMEAPVAMWKIHYSNRVTLKFT